MPKDKVLDDAVEAYFRLVEQGQRPDRKSFVANYPDHAKELAQLLSDVDFLHDRRHRTHGSTEEHKSTELYSDGAPPIASVPTNGAPLEPHMQLGGFRLLEELGRGRQGMVYKARQRGTQRIVALKVIREGAFASAGERLRFENEVRVAALLHHPNIIAIHECGQDAGRDFFAMEFVDGVSLDRYCEQQSLDTRAIVELFAQVCSAVGYAHEHAVLHRDLKASNVLVDAAGVPHVLDFGLAKTLGGEDGAPAAAVTEVGDFAGTLYYASPEQVLCDPALLDVRSDVYALGVMLYELLTGCLPYPVMYEPRERIGRIILETPPRPLRQIVANIDSDLETIVLRALSKEPARRYASATMLADDLRRYLAGDPIEARRDDTWYVLRRIVRRHFWKFAAAAGALLLLVGVTITVLILLSQAKTSERLAIKAQHEARSAQEVAQDAWQTTEHRLKLALNSQDYLVKFLDEVQAVLNGFHAVVEEHPNLPAVQRYLKPSDETLYGSLDQFACDMPKEIIVALGIPGSAERREVCEWLEINEPSLIELITLLKERAPVFAVQGTLSEGVFGQRWPDFPVVERMIVALAAHALWRSQLDDSESALESLSAARELAYLWGNGRLSGMKAQSIIIRGLLYDVFARILEHAGEDMAVVGKYLPWIERDPPLPVLRPAVLLDQLASVNAVQAAARSEGDGSHTYVDVDVINQLTGFSGDDLVRMTGATRASGRAVTPQSALAILDQYYGEFAQWDSLTFPELEERAAGLRERLNAHPAVPVVRMLFQSYLPSQKNRGRCQAARSATKLAGALCSFRAENGYWPESLDELDLDHFKVTTHDPYMGQPFGYRLVDGLPILYSVNEDGFDDGGQSGEWGAYGKDVVLFRPVR